MSGSSVKPNGILIRGRRLAKGWSQETLAKASGINGRTVQRAENSDPITRETAAQLAASLGATVNQLMAQEEPEADHPNDPNLVVLRRAESARLLIEGLSKSDRHVIDYDFDPTPESVNDLAAFVEMLEMLEPFQERQWENPLTDLSSRIRFTAEFSEKMASLAGHGINVFYGEYVIMEARPRWDPEEGCWAVWTLQKPEPMTVARVRLSAKPGPKISLPIERVRTAADADLMTSRSRSKITPAWPQP
jgi:transcriptional regulator with XRE-family HTH domain